MTTQLDSFETALLDRLERHRSAAVAAAARRRTVRRRVVAAAGVVAATVAGVLVVPGLGPTTAYSVSEGNSGEITVEVRRLEDASGLEAALAEHGVAADIRYLPWGQACAEGRYDPVARRSSGLSVSMGSDLLRVVLPPGTVRDDETVVMWVSGRSLTADELEARSDEDGTALEGMRTSVQLDVAPSPVAPCVVVPAPTPTGR